MNQALIAWIARRAGILATLLALTISASTFAQSVQVRLADGARWRGSINDDVSMVIREGGVEQQLTGRLVKAEDLYVVLETNVAGVIREKTIFRADILKMSSGVSETDAADRATIRRNDAARNASENDVPRDASGRELGVFVLPLDGMVGEGMRHDEILAIGEEADKYGPGQIIVLSISTNGGLVTEALAIEEAIYKVRERHRVIAWVNNKAISAGCMTAMCCDEIYFTTEGTCGSVTTITGAGSVQGEEGQRHVEAFVETALKNGYNEHLARAMKMNRYMCSYDKDPDTGEVTFYDDLSGEFVLSDGESNLCFNSSNALHCGFSKGTADTKQELAKLLDLPKWHEISDKGRVIAQRWQDTVEQAKEEIPRLMAQRQYKNASLGMQQRLGTLIQIDKSLIRWCDRAPNVVYLMLGDPEQLKKQLEREIRELRRQLGG